MSGSNRPHHSNVTCYTSRCSARLGRFSTYCSTMRKSGCLQPKRGLGCRVWQKGSLNVAGIKRCHVWTCWMELTTLGWILHMNWGVLNPGLKVMMMMMISIYYHISSYIIIYHLVIISYHYLSFISPRSGNFFLVPPPPSVLPFLPAMQRLARCVLEGVSCSHC